MDPNHRYTGSDVSSSADTVNVEVIDQEKAQLGQAPLPAAPAPTPAIPVTEKNPKSKKRKSQDEKSESDEGEDPFAHLPPHEAAVLKRQLDVPPVNVTYKTLFRYSTRNDKIIMAVSAISSIIGGALLPLMTVVFGGLTTTFKDFFAQDITKGHFNAELSRFSLYFLYLAIGEFVFVYIATAGFLYTGEHIASKIRENFLRATLRQNIGYYDNLGAGEITTRITSDTNLVQDGISEKIGLTLTVSSIPLFSSHSWSLRLTLYLHRANYSFTSGSGNIHHSFHRRFRQRLEAYLDPHLDCVCYCVHNGWHEWFHCQIQQSIIGLLRRRRHCGRRGHQLCQKR